MNFSRINLIQSLINRLGCLRLFSFKSFNLPCLFDLFAPRKTSIKLRWWNSLHPRSRSTCRAERWLRLGRKWAGWRVSWFQISRSGPCREYSLPFSLNFACAFYSALKLIFQVFCQLLFTDFCHHRSLFNVYPHVLSIVYFLGTLVHGYLQGTFLFTKSTMLENENSKHNFHMKRFSDAVSGKLFIFILPHTH